MIKVHHNPDDADGRVWMLEHPVGQVWRLTTDSARELYAQLGLRLAHARAVEFAAIDRRSMPFADWAAEQEDRRLDLMGERY